MSEQRRQQIAEEIRNYVFEQVHELGADAIGLDSQEFDREEVFDVIWKMTIGSTVWVVSVTYNGNLEITEAYVAETDADKRVEELTKNYHSVSVQEVPIL